MKNLNVILAVVVGGILLYIMLSFAQKGCNEKFCSVAPKFDHYYHVHSRDDSYSAKCSCGCPLNKCSCPYGCKCGCYKYAGPGGMPSGDSPIRYPLKTDDRADDNPIYKRSGGPYSNYYSEDGVEPNLDTQPPKGCRTCGGDYISVAPKRDRYYQMYQGYLGDNIMSGYPYYSAMGGTSQSGGGSRTS